jgi:hypothetical protein
MNNELEYGAVFVFQGRHKGRVLYYDDDGAPRTAICYVGHPIDFVGTPQHSNSIFASANY